MKKESMCQYNNKSPTFHNVELLNQLNSLKI
nr:MAG TPA_asm: hypothetical protein [Caudoviricetes sp.]